MDIKYIDLKNFDEREVEKIKELTNKYFKKYKRFLTNNTLIVHPHKHDRGGKKTKYAIHVRIENPNLLLSSKASDWDLARTLHKSFKKIEKEIQHKFKTEGQFQGKIHKSNTSL